MKKCQGGIMNGNEAMAHRRLNETKEENALLADVYYNGRSVMENAMIDMEKLHDKITQLIVSHRFKELFSRYPVSEEMSRRPHEIKNPTYR